MFFVKSIPQREFKQYNESKNKVCVRKCPRLKSCVVKTLENTPLSLILHHCFNVRSGEG